MTVRDVVVAAAAALAGFAVSACDSTATGTPTPETSVSTASETSGSSASSTESDRLAPPVENPKNLRGIDACELLTLAQLTELSFTEPGEKDTSGWGEENCIWQNSILGVSLSPDTTLGKGLDQAYRNKNRFDNFEESSVDGHPAVRVNFATQSCGLIVGVSEEQTLSMDFTRVSSQAPGLNDPCGFAESVAGMVLENLPAG